MNTTNTLIENISAAQLCSALCQDKTTPADTVTQEKCSSVFVRLDRNLGVRGEKGGRANGLVAGLRNPVLQFVGIVEIVSLRSKQNQCPPAPFPPE